mmetsp:Transcript_21232/g.51297  ORF Transcript_21232/g.51297 Transcript_21232/m.51297 type:complete len:264 (+) Transcript_21232:169-960(+)
MTTKEETAAVDEAQYTLGPNDKVAVKKHVKRGGGAGWARVTVRDATMKDSILQWGVAGQWPADLATKGHEAPYYSVHQISGKACYIKSHEKKEKGDSDKKDKEDPDADKPKLFVRYENKGKDDNDIPEIEFKKYFEDILDQMEKQDDWRNSNAVKNADQMPGIFNPYAFPNPYMMYAQGGFPWPAFGTWGGYGGWEQGRKGKGKGKGRGKGKGEGKGKKDKKKKDKDGEEEGESKGDDAEKPKEEPKEEAKAATKTETEEKKD